MCYAQYISFVALKIESNHNCMSAAKRTLQGAFFNFTMRIHSKMINRF